MAGGRDCEIADFGFRIWDCGFLNADLVRCGAVNELRKGLVGG